MAEITVAFSKGEPSSIQPAFASRQTRIQIRSPESEGRHAAHLNPYLLLTVSIPLLCTEYNSAISMVCKCRQ